MQFSLDIAEHDGLTLARGLLVSLTKFDKFNKKIRNVSIAKFDSDDEVFHHLSAYQTEELPYNVYFLSCYRTYDIVYRSLIPTISKSFVW